MMQIIIIHLQHQDINTQRNLMYFFFIMYSSFMQVQIL